MQIHRGVGGLLVDKTFLKIRRGLKKKKIFPINLEKISITKKEVSTNRLFNIQST